MDEEIGRKERRALPRGFAGYLVNKGLLEKEVVQSAIEQAAGSGKSLISNLIDNHILKQEVVASEASSYFGYPVFDLDAYDISYSPEEMSDLPVIEQHIGIPLSIHDNCLYLGVADPTAIHPNELRLLKKLSIKLIIVEEHKLHAAIDKLQSQKLLSELDQFDDAELDLDVSTYEEQEEEETISAIDEAPVVRYVNKILLEAINSAASDIHFEPFENFFRIRMRVDGILQNIAKPPIQLVNHFIARLKVMSNLDIAERRIPQDGRFKITLSKTKSIDFRVSSCPTIYGEKVVVRLLDPTQTTRGADNLGFKDDQKEAFLETIEYPQGMILVTGPTGSGKTVTLYTALGLLNNTEVNVCTVEDPVEIRLSGINQVQVNQKAGLDFASALRSFLRQDPDIIMVGEIRDLETAEISIKAAQTGHLVLSTLHTKSAAETIARLNYMGVPAYNIASSLLMVIAQRLARRLCEHCKIKDTDTSKEVLLAQGFKKDELKDLVIYKPGSCSKCNGGYKGRVAIFEVMPISKKMASLIMQGADAIEISKQEAKENIANLHESGLEKVRTGITTLEEVNRVIEFTGDLSNAD